MKKTTRDHRSVGGRCAPVALLATAVGAVAFIAPIAFAGPDWDKDLQVDAGSSLANAQIITVNGTVARIRGALTGSAFDGVGAGDFQDVYLFQITDPTTFKLEASNGGKGIDFDSCMWLFSYEGKALLGNNDAAPGQLGSILLNQSNDGQLITITTPGLYYVAISGFASQPLDGETPLWPDSVFTAGNITGAFDGRFTGNWSGDGATGSYSLDVEGVAGVPAPGAVALFALAGLTGRRRRA
ncbi:MAG: DVUA0089 family protein [Phycisphaerales bacterium]